MIEFLAKGKRGLVYVERKKGIAVKKTNPESEANNRLRIEADFLKLLNRHKIGPNFISFKDDELSMEYVDGERITDYFKNEKTSKEDIKKVIINVFEQLRVMDKLGINKHELTNPHKHIIIKGNKPIMIDFERCRYTKKPKNITQFIQFLCSSRIKDVFEEKGIAMEHTKLGRLAEEYKKSYSEEVFKKILELFP